MKLQEFFGKNNIKYTYWAKKNSLPPSLIFRALSGKGITLENANEIVKATNGQVTLEELLFPQQEN